MTRGKPLGSYFLVWPGTKTCRHIIDSTEHENVRKKSFTLLFEVYKNVFFSVAWAFKLVAVSRGFFVIFSFRPQTGSLA